MTQIRNVEHSAPHISFFVQGRKPNNFLASYKTGMTSSRREGGRDVVDQTLHLKIYVPSVECGQKEGSLFLYNRREETQQKTDVCVTN